MSKVKTNQYGLKFGHPTEFRRTVEVGKGKDAKRFTLVFQPNTPYDLTAEEITALKGEIDCCLLTPWDEDDRRARMIKNEPGATWRQPAEGTTVKAEPVVESHHAADEHKAPHHARQSL